MLDPGRAIDPTTGMVLVKLFSGDCYATSARDEMLVTILGSCIAACIRDPLAGVGGMNHFLLPGDGDGEISGKEERYGAFAMEKLINDIIKMGGIKARLEVKVFGGGNVIRNSAQIGSRNAAFIRHFLEREGLQLAAADLEGDLPRRIHYIPSTGKVWMRKLAAATEIVQQETAYRARVRSTTADEGEVDLF